MAVMQKRFIENSFLHGAGSETWPVRVSLWRGRPASLALVTLLFVGVGKCDSGREFFGGSGSDWMVLEKRRAAMNWMEVSGWVCLPN
jgi:hypothetical protein